MGRMWQRLNTGTASTVLLTTNVPPGTYFTRVRSLSSTGAVSAASNEAHVTVSPLSQIPPTYQPHGRRQRLNGHVDVDPSYVGSYASLLCSRSWDLLWRFECGDGDHPECRADPRGIECSERYDFTRVSSVSAAALTSLPSNEVQLTVGTSCGAPSPPASITTGVSSRTVTVSWNRRLEPLRTSSKRAPQLDSPTSSTATSGARRR